MNWRTKSVKGLEQLGMKCKLGEVCDFQNGFAFKSKDFLSSGRYKVIKIKELKNGEIRYFDDSAYIDDFSDRIKQFVVNKGDVLFALTGDPVNRNNPLSWVGRVSKYDYDEIAFINQRVCKVLVDENKLDKNYLYYYFRLFDNFYSLAQKATGSANQANISTKTIADMEIDLPSISIQQAIASTLSVLDAKIANNTKINHHLEQTAQAIFIDMLGSVLYPNSDYTITPMSDWLCFVNGFAFKSSTYLDIGKYKVITIKNVQDGLVDSTGASCLDALPKGFNPACELVFGDVLLSLTGNVGRVGIVTENDLLLNQRVAKFDPIKRELLPFWYFLFRQNEMKEHLINIAKGTAQQNLSPFDVLKTKIIFDENIATEYSEIVTPIFWTIAENRKESAFFISLRDSILPCLMSGELSFSDIVDDK